MKLHPEPLVEDEVSTKTRVGNNSQPSLTECDLMPILAASVKLPLYTRQIERDRFAVCSVHIGYNVPCFIPSRMFCHGDGVS